MIFKIKRVVVGISGGVDSAVAALLLKNKGFDVHGVFMQNWDIADEQGECSASKDYKDASLVCNKLGVPLHYVNFVKYYWNHVFSNLLKEYQLGFTPNPDILCNKYIKFDRFVNYAMENLNADAIATGHYANTSFGPYLENYDPNSKVKLLRAENVQKDQTLFLSQISQEALRKTMFPLANLMKSTVKEIALENDLVNVVKKKESMGICFIGSRNFQSFISEYIENKPGYFIDIDSNVIKGSHNGIHHWTIGQRSRLSSYVNSNYIARKDITTNNIYVAEGWRSYALHTDFLQTSKAHWIHSEPPELQRGTIFLCEFKFQHVESLQKCWVFTTRKGLIVSLKQPIRAVNAGQYAVFYKDNECLGSARIVHPGLCTYFYVHKYNRTVKTKENTNISKKFLDAAINKMNAFCNVGIKSKIQHVQ